MMSHTLYSLIDKTGHVVKVCRCVVSEGLLFVYFRARAHAYMHAHVLSIYQFPHLLKRGWL